MSTESYGSTTPAPTDTQRVLLGKILNAVIAGGTGGGGSAPTISSFTNSVSKAETGSTVSSTVLNWTLSGAAITSQSINQGIGSLAIELRTVTDSASYTTNRTYTLSAVNAIGTSTSTTSVSFMSKLYRGVSANTSLNDGQIIALTGVLQTTFATTFTVSPSAQYIYFAFPTSYGVPQILVNGLLNTAWTLVTRAFVNASGYSSSYDIYRSTNLLTGTYIVTLQ